MITASPARSSRLSEIAVPASAFELAERFAVLRGTPPALQPWFVTRAPSGLEVRLRDTEAQEPQIAVSRALLACGAALQNARLALCAEGHGASIHLLPKATDSAVMALVEIGEAVRPSSEDEALFAVLRGGLVLRGPRGRASASPALLALLRHVVKHEGAWLECVAEGARRAALCALIERSLATAAAAAKSNSRRSAVSDHATEPYTDVAVAPLQGLLTNLGAPLATAATRCCERTPRAGAEDGDAPFLLVLGTSRHTPRDLLRAGMAIQRLLLHLAVQGFTASLLHAPMEDLAAAVELHEMFADLGEPRTIIRVEARASGIPLSAYRSLVLRPPA